MSDSGSQTQRTEGPVNDDVEAELRAIAEDDKKEEERCKKEEEERAKREEVKRKRREELLAEKKRRDEAAARKKAEEEERLRKEREDADRREREERERREKEEKERQEKAETEARERAKSVAEEQNTGQKDKGKGKERGRPLSGSPEERPRPSKRPNLAEVIIDVDKIGEAGPSRYALDRMGRRIKMGGQNVCGRCRKLGIDCEVSEFRGRVACDHCEWKKQACGFEEPERKEKGERKGRKGPTITIPSKVTTPGGVTHEQGQDMLMSLEVLINGQGMMLRVLEQIERHLGVLAAGREQVLASGSRSGNGWGNGVEWSGVEDKEGEDGSSEASEEGSEGGEESGEEEKEEEKEGMNVDR